MRRNLCLAFSLLLAGCGMDVTSDVSPPTSPSESVAPATSEAPANENTTSDSGEEKSVDTAADKASGVAIVEDDGTEFQKYLEANRGKVILVDCWATWCGPCKEGFPSTVALHEKYKDRGLIVVSVSFDDSGDEEERPANKEGALAFLKQQKATFKNFFAATGLGTESGKPFGVTVALPRYRVIDREGKDRFEQKKLEGKELEAEIARLVETLVAEGN